MFNLAKEMSQTVWEAFGELALVRSCVFLTANVYQCEINAFLLVAYSESVSLRCLGVFCACAFYKDQVRFFCWSWQ